MIEYLELIDRQLVIAINSLHNPLLDEVMWLISAKLTWIPLYLFLFWLAYKQLGLKLSLLFLLFVIISVSLSDLLSVHAIKDVVKRYRPSHNLLLINRLHFYQITPTDYYKGGEYGFVSSHAANFFVVYTAFMLVFKKRYSKMVYTLLGISITVCLSRIYLGVHYFSDIIGGAVLGAVITYLVYNFFWLKVAQQKKD